MKKFFLSYKKIIPFLKARYAPRGARLSFSATGEDIIIAALLAKQGVKKVFYVDIGAHHPIFGNNTYLFYRSGGRGVLIEPTAELCTVIQKKRPKDTCLNAGVGKENGESIFYAFQRSTRNTFSPHEAKAWQQQSGERATEKKMKIFSLDHIIDTYCERTPDIVSLDAEGYDFDILSGFSWKKRPKVFCIETASSSGARDADGEQKNIRSLMEKNGYALTAQVSVNVIFVDTLKN